MPKKSQTNSVLPGKKLISLYNQLLWLCPLTGVVAAIVLLWLAGLTLWTVAVLILLITCPFIVVWVLVIERQQARQKYNHE